MNDIFSHINFKNSSGAILILGFPDAICSTTQSILDPFLKLTGISYKGKVCAGHAALVLINRKSGELIYADYGRYITPKGRGRIRTAETDPEVALPIKAHVDAKNNLLNLKEIITFLDAHPELTHGDGRMVFSLLNKVDFDKAQHFIETEQGKGNSAYGPFAFGGSNCTRFVADLIMASSTDKKVVRNLRKVLPTPSTVSNVLYGRDVPEIYEIHQGEILQFGETAFENAIKSFLNRKLLKTKADKGSRAGNLDAPSIASLPPHAQWLPGTGAGSWFAISAALNGTKKGIDSGSSSLYCIQRIDPDGRVVFEKNFEAKQDGFEINSAYQFVYDCHAKSCKIEQNGKEYYFEAQQTAQ